MKPIESLALSIPLQCSNIANLRLDLSLRHARMKDLRITLTDGTTVALISDQRVSRCFFWTLKFVCYEVHNELVWINLTHCEWYCFPSGLHLWTIVATCTAQWWCSNCFPHLLCQRMQHDIPACCFPNTASRRVCAVRESANVPNTLEIGHWRLGCWKHWHDSECTSGS